MLQSSRVFPCPEPCELELSPYAVADILLDAHDDMTGVEVLARRVEADGENVSGLESEQSVSAADAYVGGFDRLSGFGCCCI